MKEGHNVLCGEDKVDGIRGRLRGTHVCPIEINRDAEPPSAKSLTGNSQYGDFEYTTDGIVMRENTAIGQGKLYNNDSLSKLSNNTFNTTAAATGFYISHAKHVPKLVPKISKSKTIWLQKSKGAAQPETMEIHNVNAKIVEKSSCAMETFKDTENLRLGLLRNHNLHRNQKAYNACLIVLLWKLPYVKVKSNQSKNNQNRSLNKTKKNYLLS